jgi:tetratricopeptide (TPR) repeat protein
LRIYFACTHGLLQVVDDWHCNYAVGICLRQLEQYSGTYEAYENALRLDAQERPVLLSLSIARQLNSELEKSVAVAKFAIEIDADYCRAYNTWNEVSKESLSNFAADSILRQHLNVVLERLIVERVCPLVVRNDNGPEFVNMALMQSAAVKGFRNFFIEPGKPWQNGIIENFNGQLRDHCLAINWFYSRVRVRVIIEVQRRHLNEVLPHSGLG